MRIVKADCEPFAGFRRVDTLSLRLCNFLLMLSHFLIFNSFQFFVISL